jgi:putative nucleotidyltransferase with HDIG domain
VALVLTMGGHLFTPVGPYALHVVHLVLRKLLLAPVLLGAVWFGLRGSLLVATTAAVLFSFHIYADWQGFVQENMNQVGEIASVFIVAVLAGILMDREKAALHEVGRTHEGALTAMVSALDAREHDTQLHSLRVRAYALYLGKRMGLSRRELLQLGQGALLHDIGKIGIPDDLLMKPGKLSEEEWSVMRTHPAIGGKILESVTFLDEAAEIVRAHHERFDGTGYPEGLQGNEIPLGARIFAVIDVLDALTTDRPYREKLSYSEVREHIKRGSGKHFDPKVVRAFLDVPAEAWQQLAKRCGIKGAYELRNDSDPTTCRDAIT